MYQHPDQLQNKYAKKFVITMARPIKEESIHRITIYKNRGYRYATTHPYTVTPEEKREYKILNWGSVDKNLKFIPDLCYIYASHEERSKLIFPEDCDMNLAYKLSGKRSQDRASYDGDDLNRFYGDVWLLEQGR